MASGPSKFDRLPKTLASVRDFNAPKAIVVFLVGGLLYYGHAAFIPVALALLLALILSSPVEALHKRGVSRGLSATLILVAALGIFAGFVSLSWSPVQDWYASAPQTLSIIQRKITPVARLMNHLEELSERAGSVGGNQPLTSEPAVVAASQSNAARIFLGTLRNGAIGLTTVTILTLFLLAGGPPMVARMTAAFFDHLKANHVQRDIEKVRAEVGQYYVTMTFINLGLGLATTIAMFVWQMPTPYLWGAVAALLNYIPYLGSAVTLFMVTVVALVSFDGLTPVIGVGLTYLALAAIGGQIVQPLLIGRRLAVNPLLIFLGLWFGGTFWGIAGVILATPMLVAFKVIAENALNGQSMLNFLGPNTPSDKAVSSTFSR